MTKLLSFALILLATRSKCVSEDSKKIKTNFAKKKCQNFLLQIVFQELFFLESSETCAKKCLQNQSKKNAKFFFLILLRGLLPRVSDVFRLNPPSQLSGFLSPRNLKLKFCLTKLLKKNRTIVFVCFRTLRIF